MAWPKGKSRKPVPIAHERFSAPVTVEPVVVAFEPPAPTTAPDPSRSSTYHRQITALRVRRIPIPRDIRIHDYMPLAQTADRIRKEMAEAGAPDSEVEAFVARHVPAD